MGGWRDEGLNRKVGSADAFISETGDPIALLTDEGEILLDRAVLGQDANRPVRLRQHGFQTAASEPMGLGFRGVGVGERAELNQVCDRVDVDGMRFASKSQGFERDRTAASEGIKDSGNVAVRIRMEYLMGFLDQLAGGIDIVRLIRVLPPDEVLDELQTPIPRRIFNNLAVLAFGFELTVGKLLSDQLAKPLRALRIVRVRDE